MAHASYEKLAVWQRSIELVEFVYRITRDFPSDEKSGLAATLRRTVTAVPAKIADADGLDDAEKIIQTLNGIRGTIREMLTYAVICRRLGFLSFMKYKALRRRLVRIDRVLRMHNEQLSESISPARHSPRLAA